MIKYILFLFLFISFLGNTQQFCGTDEMHQKIFQKHPEYNKNIINSYTKLEVETQNFNSINRAGATYIIPVVFHVIHQNGVENISEEQIKDQIRILNRDYGTADTTVIIDSFKQIVANCEIEFRLATLDPNGNCTKGITRHVSSLTTTGTHAVKSIIQWPPNKYLNFYVVVNAAGLAGHALLPYAADSLPQWDGIVMSHNSIGSIGTSNLQRSVVASHEVGHYLNLQHVWGGNNVPNFPYLPVSNSGNCSYDDGVGDTPNTIGNQSCNLSSTTCGSLDNVQNFMDYSYCGAMFTVGQKNRMHAALNSTVANRNNLWSLSNLIATGTDTVSLDLCEVNFEANKTIVCVGDSVTFWDKSYHKVTTRVWSFNGGIATSLTDSIVKVVYNTPGKYKVKLVAINGIDIDSVIKEKYIIVTPTTGNLNFISEDFEFNFSIPNYKWIKGKIDSNNWIIENTVGYNSNQSLKYNSFTNNGKSELISTTIDASGYTNMQIQFDYAYTQKELNSTDRLNVFYSNTCGDSWVLKKTYPSFLLLTKFPVDTLPFVPSGSNEWKQASIAINGTFLVSNLLVKFEFEGTDKGNNFYIDNINIIDPATASIKKNKELDFEMYPNPVSNKLYISNLPITGTISLLDVSGKVISVYKVNEKTRELSLSFLAKGIYFLQLQNKNGSICKRIIKK